MPSAAESSLLFAASLCGVSSGVIPAHWRTQEPSRMQGIRLSCAAILRSGAILRHHLSRVPRHPARGPATRGTPYAARIPASSFGRRVKTAWSEAISMGSTPNCTSHHVLPRRRQNRVLGAEDEGGGNVGE
jgi:hypothetical protein